ncbi:hypothetical protein [Armatimonas sp.]|uniref:hypothetical protein n=1 Tax=Armatimonas sp. TaxID=1872638 RepID=UPI00286B8BAB|nr:hypothetical protein [Armatimonas sp.]
MPITPLDVLKKLWEQRDLLQKGWLSLQRTIKSGKTVIAVFGPGGVGKTTFGVYLSPDFDPARIAKQYEESPGIEEQWLKLDSAQKIWIAPGQETSRIEKTWPLLNQKLTRAKRKAIIVFVVSYGYHTPRPDRTITDWNAYIIEKRTEELRFLERVVSYFEQTPTSDLRFLTLVTKEDIWWPEHDTVIAHYEQGEYKKLIDRLFSQKGRDNFHHEFAYLSLRHENLKNASESTIAFPTAAGYEDTLFYSHQERAMSILKELLK